MNLRAVLRTYGMLRSLTDDETTLLETLRRFTDTEREAFVEALGERKVAKKAGKQPSKRASSLKKVIAGKIDNPAPSYCRHVGADSLNCGQYEDANVHHLTTDVNYHPFVAAEPVAGAGGG